MIKIKQNFSLHKYHTTKDTFLSDVLLGLTQKPKSIPSKYFYDERGSHLFNEICSTEEYYLTRTELAIMRKNIDEMTDIMGEGSLLIEYGSGSGEKTRLLLDNLDNIAGYVPIDISLEHLEQAARSKNETYPQLEVMAVYADFTEQFEIPKPQKQVTHKVVYFPGSTIGNFTEAEAKELFNNMASFCEPGDALLIGVDLKKEHEILNRAYNDEAGVTAAFNLNLLHRINRELGSDFIVDHFDHKAFYNSDQGRVEMHLVSLKDQDVNLHGNDITFAKGESIFTESSHKYTIDEFSDLAKSVNLELRKSWVDDNQLFSVLYFEFE